MDSVKLMDRKECKYTVSNRNLIVLLNNLPDDYYVLEIDKQRIMPYRSVYYDDNEFSLYNSHQNGKLDRFKVRRRTYSITGQEFLEIKHKTNKKRTVKKRIDITGGDLVGNKEFLKRYLPVALESLEEKLEINFHRITLVDKNMTERVTVDMNLSYSADGVQSSVKDLSIIEVKFDGNKRESKIVELLNRYRVKPQSFSKYCYGILSHYDGIKKNSFNEKNRSVFKSLKGDFDTDNANDNRRRVS